MSKLKRELGVLDIFCIASGAMISSGLFILPGLAYFKSGPAIVVAYLIAGVLVLPSMLSKAELVTAMGYAPLPKTTPQTIVSILHPEPIEL